jgi:predicted RNase H-like HicB family nuclease
VTDAYLVLLARKHGGSVALSPRCRSISRIDDEIEAMAESIPTGVYEIRAQWDDEAGVWVAESDDVPGLVAEADSPKVLVQKLRTLIPELLARLSQLKGISDYFDFQTRVKLNGCNRVMSETIVVKTQPL